MGDGNVERKDLGKAGHYEAGFDDVPFLKQLWQGVLNLAFPSRCAVCAVSLPPDSSLCICGDCWKSLPRIIPPFCPVCGRPIASDAYIPYDIPCGECRLGKKTHGICRAAGIYTNGLQRAIHAFKYEGRTALARPLALLIFDMTWRDLAQRNPEALVPVPLHRAKRRERGFNQALLLARELKRHTGIPVVERVLVRTVPGTSQSRLKRKERLSNVRGVFMVRVPTRIRGKRLILVDDVRTTGATTSECAKILLKAGAKSVDICAVARGN